MRHHFELLIFLPSIFYISTEETTSLKEGFFVSIRFQVFKQTSHLVDFIYNNNELTN